MSTAWGIMLNFFALPAKSQHIQFHDDRKTCKTKNERFSHTTLGNTAYKSATTYAWPFLASKKFQSPGSVQSTLCVRIFFPASAKLDHEDSKMNWSWVSDFKFSQFVLMSKNYAQCIRAPEIIYIKKHKLLNLPTPAIKAA